MDGIDLLSQWMMLGPTYFSFKSSRRRLSRTTSYGAEVAEIYYASMLDRAMICFFFELHAIAIEPSEKTHLVVLFLSFGKPPQSLSVNPMSLNWLLCM